MSKPIPLLLASCGLTAGAILVLFTVGCDWMGGTAVRGSGVSATENREVGSFDQIDASGIGSVRITIGDSPAVRLTADDNLLVFFSSRVDDNCLVLGTTGSFSSSQPVVWEITVPRLVDLKARTAVSVQLTGLMESAFRLEVTDASTVVASGKVDTLDLVTSGSCTINLADLKAKEATAKLSGACVATVDASRSVSGTVEGAARLVCQGQPATKSVTTTGVGKVEYR